jgi:hypothetical protein
MGSEGSAKGVRRLTETLRKTQKADKGGKISAAEKAFKNIQRQIAALKGKDGKVSDANQDKYRELVAKLKQANMARKGLTDKQLASLRSNSRGRYRRRLEAAERGGRFTTVRGSTIDYGARGGKGMVTYTSRATGQRSVGVVRGLTPLAPGVRSIRAGRLGTAKTGGRTSAAAKKRTSGIISQARRNNAGGLKANIARQRRGYGPTAQERSVTKAGIVVRQPAAKKPAKKAAAKKARRKAK